MSHAASLGGERFFQEITVVGRKWIEEPQIFQVEAVSNENLSGGGDEQ
jgi:hypothetical protein